MTKKDRDKIKKMMETTGLDALVHDLNEMDRMLKHQIIKGHHTDPELEDVIAKVYDELQDGLFPKWYNPVKEAENILEEE